MSTGAAARVFVRLTGVASGRGTFIRTGAATVRLNSVRPLALSSELLAKVKSEPIKFSTSKASHRTWKVERSMGNHFKRPLGKVVPISLLLAAILMWCFFRDENNVDTVLGRQHVEKVPGLLSNEEDKAQK